jgi:4-carboxymuconolactone decarboxylase
MTRLPEVSHRDALPEEHRGVYDYLVQTRGRVSTSMAVLLHSPDLTGLIAQVGTYIRFESPLLARVREVAALASSSELQNAYEEAMHTASALSAGAGEATVQAIKAGAALDQIDLEDQLPVRCARELLRDKQLSQATFDEALQQYGEQGVVDLFATIGYYAMLACLHNAFEVPPPLPS